MVTVDLNNNVGILFLLNNDDLEYYQFFFEKESKNKTYNGNIGLEYDQNLDKFNFNVKNIHLFNNTTLGNLYYNQKSKNINTNVFNNQFSANYIIKKSPFEIYEEDIFNLNNNISDYQYKKYLKLTGDNNILKIIGLENNNILETSIYEMKNNNMEIELTISGTFNNIFSYDFSIDSLDSIRVSFDFFNYGFGYNSYSDIINIGIWNKINWKNINFDFNYLFEDNNGTAFHNTSLIYSNKNSYKLGGSIKFESDVFKKYSLGFDIYPSKLFDECQLNYTFYPDDNNFELESYLKYFFSDLKCLHYFNYNNQDTNSIHNITRRLINK